MIPTTTPTAIPALLDPLDFEMGDGDDDGVASWVWPGAVTTTVFPTVTTDGDCFCVVVAIGASVVWELREPDVELVLELGLGLALEDWLVLVDEGELDCELESSP